VQGVAWMLECSRWMESKQNSTHRHRHCTVLHGGGDLDVVMEEDGGGRRLTIDALCGLQWRLPSPP
jgi:hypothetical protein